MVKLLKIPLLGPYLGKNRAIMDNTENQVEFFLWKLQKIISFQKLFILSKTELWMIFCLVWYSAVKKAISGYIYEYLQHIQV